MIECWRLWGNHAHGNGPGRRYLWCLAMSHGIASLPRTLCQPCSDVIAVLKYVWYLNWMRLFRLHGNIQVTTIMFRVGSVYCYMSLVCCRAGPNIGGRVFQLWKRRARACSHLMQWVGDAWNLMQIQQKTIVSQLDEAVVAATANLMIQNISNNGYLYENSF